MRTYNHFINNIGANSHTDLHIYHCDETLFLNLLEKNKGAYDYFIVMPHFQTEDLKHLSLPEKVGKALRSIPSEKLIILDNIKSIKNKQIVQIYQDFENDIYTALNEGLEKIRKYKKIMLVYPENAVYPYPRRILHGFRKFCVEHDLDFEIIDKIYDDMVLKKGDLFIIIEEGDLVNLVKQVREDEFLLGEEVGIISYNDTPLKELLGITVMSTDFKVMGETAAAMILNKTKGTVKVPFNFIERESL